MKLLKTFPKDVPTGHTITVHYVPNEYELVQFKSGPKLCHKIKGYSVCKSKPYDPLEHKTTEQILTELSKELRK